MMWISERHSPAAATSTSTSEPCGSGTGTSVRTGSDCHCVKRIARIVVVLMQQLPGGRLANRYRTELSLNCTLLDDDRTRLMNATGRLAGKVALITGAARGMGAAHARAMAREGATVAIADIAPEAGEQLAAELRGAGGQASYHDHDVTDPAAWHDVVAAVHRAHGPIDVLVNNAGVQMRSFGIEADDDEWAKVTAVNEPAWFSVSRP